MANFSADFRQSSKAFQQQAEISFSELQLWKVSINNLNKSFPVLQMLIAEYTI